MIQNFRSKALKQAFAGNVSRLVPQVSQRIVSILAVLDSAQSIEDIEPLTGFHNLVGDRQGMCAVSVTRNWRITFTPVTQEVEDPDTQEMESQFHVRDVDYEDYH